MLIHLSHYTKPSVTQQLSVTQHLTICWIMPNYCSHNTQSCHTMMTPPLILHSATCHTTLSHIKDPSIKQSTHQFITYISPTTIPPPKTNTQPSVMQHSTTFQNRTSGTCDSCGDIITGGEKHCHHQRHVTHPLYIWTQKTSVWTAEHSEYPRSTASDPWNNVGEPYHHHHTIN